MLNYTAGEIPPPLSVLSISRSQTRQQVLLEDWLDFTITSDPNIHETC